MKLSALIKSAQEAYEKHGDYDVYFCDSPGCSAYEMKLIKDDEGIEGSVNCSRFPIDEREED